MAIFTLSATRIAPEMSTCESKPESYGICKDDFAATAIQAAARMYLAKKEWEILYIQHIQDEVFRLKNEAQANAKKAKKRKILDKNAAIVQALARGYIIRNGYRESDKILRGDVGLSLMESVRKRMDIRQKIEALKQQLSEVRAAKSNNTSDSDCGTENSDFVSVRKVEHLKGAQHKLQIKAKTLEAVTRPLQEKFEGLRAEHEKLRKKYGKIESKNESRKYANETAAELLKEKTRTIDDTRDELATSLSSEGIEKVSRERSKAQQRLDTLVETSGAYANLGGMNERDASAFADEVARIGKEAHKKAKLFGDSLRSHMSSNLTKTWSSRSITSSLFENRSATDTTAAVAPLTKTESATSRPILQKRGHGRVLQKLLRDRSRRSVMDAEQNRSLSPTMKRPDGSFKSCSSDDDDNMPKRFFVKRDPSRRTILERERELQNRTPSPQRREKRGSFNNTPVISNKMKLAPTVTPKITNKMKISSAVTPKINGTPKVGNTQTPKMSNKHTPKTTNVTSTSNPMRRTSSATPALISQVQRGLRKVLSERTMIPTDTNGDAQDSPPTSRLRKLKEELWDECKSRKIIKSKKDESKQQQQRKSRSKSRDRSDVQPSRKSKTPTRKKKDKDRMSRKPKHANNKSRSKSRSRSSRDGDPLNLSVARHTSDSGGLLRGRRPNINNVNLHKEEEEEEDCQDQPKRYLSLNAPAIHDIRKNKNKRTYLRRTTSLTESSKNRRKFVDECIGSRGMMPDLV